MGSFDVSCGISGLPIRCGTQVRVIPLTKSPYDEYGPTGKWFPRCLPIKSKYDDYNNFAKEAEEQNPEIAGLWVQGFRKDFVKSKSGRSEALGLSLTKTSDFSKVQNLLHYEAIQVKCDASGTPVLPVRNGFVREDVWQTLLAMPISHPMTYDNARWELAKVKTEAKQVMEETRVRILAVKETEQALGKIDVKKAKEVARHLARANNLLMHGMGGESSPFRDGFQGSAGPGEHLYDWLEANPEAPIPVVFSEALAELCFVQWTLWHLSKQWMPSPKCGPQFKRDVLALHSQYQKSLALLASREHREAEAERRESQKPTARKPTKKSSKK